MLATKELCSLSLCHGPSPKFNGDKGKIPIAFIALQESRKLLDCLFFLKYE